MILGPLFEASNGSSEVSPVIPPHNSMIQCLLETPGIEAVLSTSDEIKEAQLQKLALNALISPLTAIFRCKIGQLFGQPPRLALMMTLLEETGEIIRAIQSRASHEPENLVFSNKNLSALVLRISKTLGESKSSMLQDIEAGRKTEIDNINGYLVSQAKQLGLPYANNDSIVKMVKQRRVIRNDQISSLFDMSSQASASEGLKIGGSPEHPEA